jgi:hypothetical protein
VTNHREEIDPLEAELAAMRPAWPSPALYAAVEQRLARHTWARHAAVWFAPVAAAACAAVVLLALRHRPPNPLPPRQVTVAPAALPPAGPDRDAPALANYRGAAELSAAELDDLLDRHAARSLAGGTRASTTARAGALRGLGLP